MDTDPDHWLPGSFFRRPTWRWLRAEYLTATGRRLDPRFDDDWVTHARAVLRGRARGPAVAEVRAAREVWTGDPLVKGELEAFLLTPEPLDRIAGRLGLSAALVEAYAEVFFAVRPLRATDWLLTRAVGYSPLRGFTGPPPTAAWKLAAFAGGPLFLEVVIAATTDRPLPDEFLTVPERRRAYEDARVRSIVQIWVAAMAATTDAEFARVARARRQLRDLDARLTGRREPVPRMVAAMESLLALMTASEGTGRAASRQEGDEGKGPVPRAARTERTGAAPEPTRRESWTSADGSEITRATKSPPPLLVPEPRDQRCSGRRAG